MANGQLPGYLASAAPNPQANRAPWYKTTAPAYAGIFLSVPFMAGMAGALQYGSVWAATIGLIVGALFCFLLYYVPGMMGMRSGMPLYVVGTSTFGTHGGLLIPGILMGILQIGWHAVFTFTATTFFMSAMGWEVVAGEPTFWIVAVVWGLVFAFVGAVGISWLGALSSFIPAVPLIMIVVAAIANGGGLSQFQATFALPEVSPALIPALGLGAFAAIQAAAGFFATAGAAGADFGTNSRNPRDVTLGGFFGISLAAFVAGFFGILLMAGAMGEDASIAKDAGMGTGTLDTFAAFIGSIGHVGGTMSKAMFWLFVVACICPTAFCVFIAGNVFSTLLPKVPRIPITMVGGVVGVILAGSGIAADLVSFFLIIGASFGPIVGAMTADYLRSGGWAGPRRGINWAGYIAWACGLFVGLLGRIPEIGFPYGLSTLLSFVVGFALYIILADVGCEPPVVSLPKPAQEEPAEAPEAEAPAP